MVQNRTRDPRSRSKFLIIKQLDKLSPRSGQCVGSGTESCDPWKAMGTLWKDFSSISPVSGMWPERKQAGNQFYWHRLFSFRGLVGSRFTNLSSGLSALWKSDCDCPYESLRTAMGTLWR